MIKKTLIASVLVAAVTLGGCASFQKRLTEFNSTVSRIAPIVGKDLLMIGNIIVTAQCSPLTATVDGAAINTLKIVAPNSSAAATVQNVLTTKALIAEQLCPIVAAVKQATAVDVRVGAVPAGAPSQVIAVQ